MRGRGVLLLFALASCGRTLTLVADAGRGDAGFDAGFDAGLAVGGDILDPAEVYLAGTIDEGLCGRAALAHWSTPHWAATGFDCYFSESTAIIRPSDGRLIYVNTFEYLVREFHCDACPFTGSPPQLPTTNDPILPESCPGTQVVSGFALSPAGVLFHRCNDSDQLWRNSFGTVVYDGTVDYPLSFGLGGWVLTERRVVNLTTSQSNPITGIPPFGVWQAVRWNPPDGFFVALDRSSVTELYRVSVSGVAQLIGAYGPYPPMTIAGGNSRLDAAGRLFELARQDNGSLDVIIRREVGRPTDVVYSEATNPLVKIHISSLVTGP